MQPFALGDVRAVKVHVIASTERRYREAEIPTGVVQLQLPADATLQNSRHCLMQELWHPPAWTALPVRQQTVGGGVGVKQRAVARHAQHRPGVFLREQRHVLQRLLGLLALSYVAQYDREELFSMNLNLGNGGLNRELLTARTQPEERAQAAHAAAADSRLAVLADVPDVRRLIPLRNEPPKALPYRLAGAYPKHLLRRLVEQDNVLLGIHGDQRIHG